jgi:hypothetical protein
MSIYSTTSLTAEQISRITLLGELCWANNAHFRDGVHALALALDETARFERDPEARKAAFDRLAKAIIGNVRCYFAGGERPVSDDEVNLLVAAMFDRAAPIAAAFPFEEGRA